MKKQPIIGVLPLYDKDRESYWMLPGYLNGLKEAGALPLTLPLCSEPPVLELLCDLCDGFLFTGGQDVSPALYHETPRPLCGEPCPPRDEMEVTLLTLCIQKQIPLLGICRGIQLINVKMGGTLYQDLPTEHPSATEHHMAPPYDRPIHRVTLCSPSPLAELLQTTELAVNSYHHQAIRTLAPGLSVMAMSEDGLIEGVFLPRHPFAWGLQWHPEFSYRVSKESRAIFHAFVSAADRYSAEKTK